MLAWPTDLFQVAKLALHLKRLPTPDINKQIVAACEGAHDKIIQDSSTLCSIAVICCKLYIYSVTLQKTTNVYSLF